MARALIEDGHLDEDLLLSLLPARSSYNVGEVKTVLRSRSAAFRLLTSEQAQKAARLLCRKLRDRGEVWHRSGVIPVEKALPDLLKHPNASILQQPAGAFKALVTKNIATALYAPQHPIPFIGLEVFRSKKASVEQVPEFVQIIKTSGLVFETQMPQELDIDIFDASNYCQPTEDLSVAQVSKQLNSIVKGIKTHNSGIVDCQAVFANLFRCFAMVCRSLNCHPEVQQVLPVRFSRGALPEYQSPQYLAALIYGAEKQFLLPVRLWPIGGNSFADLNAVKNLAGWMPPTVSTIWDTPRVLNMAGDVFQRFRNYPILSIVDCVELSTRTSTSLRRYAHVWAYQDQLDDASGCHVYFPPYDRLFTSPRTVLDQVLSTCQSVELRAGTPFEVIDLDLLKPTSMSGPVGLELISETWLSSLNSYLSDTAVSQTEMFPGDDVPAMAHPLRSVFCNKSKPVDGRLSCRLHKLCHLPPAEGSLYCRPHSIAMMESYLKSETVYDGKLSLSQIRESPYANQFEVLLIRREVPEQTWIIDVEFWSLAGDKSPLPFSLSIRTLNGALVVNTTVDYNMSLWELVNEIAPHTRRDRLQPSLKALKSLYTLAERHYQRSRTHGLTIEQIRSRLQYDSQLVMSWGTVLDLQVFERILQGGNKPLAPRVRAVQNVDIFRIIQAALGDDFPSMALGDVHRCLCPGKVRHFHEADEDVLAVLDILDVLYKMVGGC